MKNIFLAPRSNETSYENFESTIIGGRSYEFIKPFLTQEEKDILSKYSKISIWGNKESLRARWTKMNPGDYVLFYARGSFYYSARVILKKFDEELGRKLWPADENGLFWPCLFFVDNLQQIEIPIKVVQELAEYEPTWDRVQGFMPLREEGVIAIIEKFGSIESFMGQSPEVYKVIENIIEINNDQIVEGEKDIVINTELLLKEAMEYKDSGPSHVDISTVAHRRVESKAQKKRIAEIENYACQICNWSLEWVNSKNKTSFRIDVDHIIDKAKGGGEEITNLWVLCPNCHVKKTLGVIRIDLKNRKAYENGKEIKIHHDKHLGWENKN